MAGKSRNKTNSPWPKCSWNRVTPENQTGPEVIRSKCEKVVKSTDRLVMKHTDKMLFDYRTDFRKRWKEVQDKTHFTVFRFILWNHQSHQALFSKQYFSFKTKDRNYFHSFIFIEIFSLCAQLIHQLLLFYRRRMSEWKTQIEKAW